jgi:Reverse transcriptase (RNA-dependent DNA polymerase)
MVWHLLSSLDHEPSTFTQANQHPHWRQAMADEFTALAANNTWKLVPRPTAQNVIGSKWVFQIKKRADGIIDHYKACLVVKGYNQQQGVDYHDTFSPVVRPTSIRLVFSIIVSNNWAIRQFDVQNTFLHGDLHEPVYMDQPPGFLLPYYSDHVFLLQKSLYNLKQLPRAWFHKLTEALLAYDFHPSNYDPSLFIYCTHHTIMYILVYVDDILLISNDPKSILSCTTFLQQKISLKDLGSLNYFLGIETHISTQGLTLLQTKYFKDLLHKTQMDQVKPCSTPMATAFILSLQDIASFPDLHLYRSVVGTLQYATIIRPYIVFVVNKVSQFMHAPTVNH